MEDILILAPAFVMAVLMLATHAYFGLHVLARGIIFVDLALAQIAALGASFAFLAGYDSHDVQAHAFAFGATLIAATLLSQIRRIPDKTSREVTIGIVYVVATALSVVILSRSAQGMEELKAIFNGNILWVNWEEIGFIALVYAALAVLHFVFRKKLYQTSYAADKKPSFFWEFMFFGSFAVVITLAVDVAGILLVFAFLIIPAFSATLLSKKFAQQLGIAIIAGILACTAGLWIAYSIDLPVGATIVSTFGLLPILTLLLRSFNRR